MHTYDSNKIKRKMDLKQNDYNNNKQMPRKDLRQPKKQTKGHTITHKQQLKRDSSKSIIICYCERMALSANINFQFCCSCCCVNMGCYH